MHPDLHDALSLGAAAFDDMFAGAARSLYFNTAGGGQVPAPLSGALGRLVQTYDRLGAMSRAALAMTDATMAAAREGVAALLGASPGSVALTDSASSALLAITAAFDIPENAAIVIGRDEHPSLEIPFLAQARRGARIVRVDAAAPPDETALPDAIAIAGLSLLSYRTGAMLHPAWAPALKARGAFFLVDATQAIGLTPVSVEALDCDALVGNGHKWLHGPMGTGFLYASDAALARLRPRGGWRAIADPRNPASLWKNARGFEGGTLCFPSFAGLAVACAWRNNEAFRQKLADARKVRAQEIAQSLPPGAASLTHEAEGFLCVSAAPGRTFDALQIADALWRDGGFDVKAFTPAERPEGALRISVSPFNAVADCTLLAHKLSDMLR